MIGNKKKIVLTSLLILILLFPLTGCGYINKALNSLLFKDTSVVGEYVGKNVQYDKDSKGNVTLELRGDGSYTEEVILLNSNSVDDLNFDSIIQQEGSYFIKDNQMSLIPSSLTQNGVQKNALELRNNPEEYGTGYTFKLEGNKLILTNSTTGIKIELTKQ